MENNLNPDVCDISGFDFGTMPKLGSNLEGLGDDLTAYLCNILKLSRREDLDPVIRGGNEFDNSVWISALTGMQGVGDPRFSMGEAMTMVLETYLKPLEIQLKILQEGCHVTDGVLCDAEGNEIPFYGKCEKPDLEMFSYDSITRFVTDLWVNALDKHADDFVTFLNDNYISKGWDVTLHSLSDGNLQKIKTGSGAPIFYVKLIKTTEAKPIYYKYYFDKKDYVANALGKSIIYESPRKFQRSFLMGLASDEGPDLELMDIIAGPQWPEKFDDDLYSSELAELNSIFKPDKIYVNISFSSQGDAGTQMYISNDKWDGTLPTSVTSGNRTVTYPDQIYLSPAIYGDQYIPIRPHNNGSFCVVLFDEGGWRNWNWRFHNQNYSRYNINITIRAGKYNLKTVLKDTNIAKFERTYRGASGSAELPCKIGYSQGYGSQDGAGPNRVTCYVINNIWSLLTPRLNWLNK